MNDRKPKKKPNQLQQERNHEKTQKKTFILI